MSPHSTPAAHIQAHLACVRDKLDLYPDVVRGYLQAPLGTLVLTHLTTQYCGVCCVVIRGDMSGSVSGSVSGGVSGVSSGDCGGVVLWM